MVTRTVGDQPPSNSGVSRRQLLRAAAAATLGLVSLAACGAPVSGPAGSSASAAPRPAVSAGAPAAAASAGAPSAGWDEVVAAAKREGKVVVTGAPDADVRTTLPAAFKQSFGIEVEYLPQSTDVSSRLQAERAAGQYRLDVILIDRTTLC